MRSAHSTVDSSDRLCSKGYQLFLEAFFCSPRRHRARRANLRPPRHRTTIEKSARRQALSSLVPSLWRWPSLSVSIAARAFAASASCPRSAFHTASRSATAAGFSRVGFARLGSRPRLTCASSSQQPLRLLSRDRFSSFASRSRCSISARRRCKVSKVTRRFEERTIAVVHPSARRSTNQSHESAPRSNFPARANSTQTCA